MTTATPLAPSLHQLLQSRPDLWRGHQRPQGPVIASGRADLDHALPGGGWPCGRLIELLPSAIGVGELNLLLPALAERCVTGWPVALIAPPLVPCPQALSQAGIDLRRLLVVRDPKQALWAAEQVLRSALCGAVVIWHPPGRPQLTALRRLQLAAEHGQALSVLIYRPQQIPPPLSSGLRLRLDPGPRWQRLAGAWR